MDRALVASAGTAPARLQDSSDLGGGLTDVVVHDDGVELLAGELLLGLGLGQPALDRLGIVGAAAPPAGGAVRRGDGACTNTSSASGGPARTARAPCTSSSSSTSWPAASASTTNCRGVPFRSP